MTAPLILIVTQRGPSGVYVGRIDGTCLSVRPSRHPLADAARSLLSLGCDPKTVLILRNSGSNTDRVSGSLAVIVRKVLKKGKSASLRRLADSEPPSEGRRAARVVRNSGEAGTG